MSDKTKSLSTLKFWGRSRLKVLSKVFPVAEPEVLLLDKLEVALERGKVNQVNVPAMRSPPISSNICPVKPECVEFDAFPTKPDISDLTAWLGGELIYPEIESLFDPLIKPRKAGKEYRQQEEVTDGQSTLFETIEEGECVHGLKKSWCATCLENKRRTRIASTLRVDPFDLIFPILQPPLGDNFDSLISFPLGKELYPFQRIGVRFLAEHDRALLGDEMGLGKSMQAIVAARFLFRLGRVATALILCPKSVLTDWEKKLWEWAPELRVIVMRGGKEQRRIYWNSPAHLYLATYETLRQDLAATLRDREPHILPFIDEQLFEEEEVAKDIAKKEFDLIILDEIQKIKNPGADITKATRQINADFRWGLSGTPLENRLEELVSIFAYLKPGLLHFDDAGRPWKVKETIKPYFLRRRKADALPDLPEKVHEEVWLELTPAQRETYDRAEREGIVALSEQGHAVTVQHVFALITRLKQICNLDLSSQESCKLEYVLEQLEQISEQGDKALIFSQYPEKTLKLLEPRMAPFDPLVYHGSLSDSQRDLIVKRFQEEDGNKVLLTSVKAGGLGLTLTRANYVCHFDLWWNPSVAAQAEDRAHRIGQNKTVFVTSLFTVGTIEERIQNLLKKKRELFKEVIDDLSDTNLSKVLTEEELFGLFSLEKLKQATSTTAKTNGKTTEKLSEEISPQQFEDLIAKLYECMGYKVKLTSQTRDKGVDIYAKRVSESGTEYLAIQCKHYPNGMVGVEHARSLYGVIQDQPSITRGVLITSGGFSKECRDFATGKRLELFDGIYLLGLLRKYSIG